MYMDLQISLKSPDTQHSRSMTNHQTIQWNIMPINTEYTNSEKRYDYSMIEFMSDDRTVATCPAMNLGFVRYNITLGYSYTPLYRWRRAIIKYYTNKHGCQQQPKCGGLYCVGLHINGTIGKGNCVIVYTWKNYELCVHCQG